MRYARILFCLTYLSHLALLVKLDGEGLPLMVTGENQWGRVAREVTNEDGGYIAAVGEIPGGRHRS